jgi:peptidoglycan/LPS O-acetylase OafA/YrhL
VGIFRIILAIAVMFDHMQTSSGEILNIIFGSLTAVRIFFMIS